MTELCLFGNPFKRNLTEKIETHIKMPSNKWLQFVMPFSERNKFIMRIVIVPNKWQAQLLISVFQLFFLVENMRQ